MKIVPITKSYKKYWKKYKRLVYVKTKSDNKSRMQY